MAYVLGTPTVQQFFDASGDPLESGTLEFYLTGTSTPTEVYEDSAGTSAGTTVSLNNRGAPTNAGGTEISLFFDTAITYKIILKDAAGTQIDPVIDPYSVPVSATGITAPVAVVAFTLNQTESPVVNHSTGVTSVSQDVTPASPTEGLITVVLDNDLSSTDNLEAIVQISGSGLGGPYTLYMALTPNVGTPLSVLEGYALLGDTTPPTKVDSIARITARIYDVGS